MAVRRPPTSVVHTLLSRRPSGWQVAQARPPAEICLLAPSWNSLRPRATLSERSSAPKLTVLTAVVLKTAALAPERVSNFDTLRAKLASIQIDLPSGDMAMPRTPLGALSTALVCTNE